MSLEPIEDACRLIARTYYGQRGTWLYDAFAAINRGYYNNELPTPLITIEITPHAGCLAWCSSSGDRPPRIAIHPTLFGVRPQGEKSPWGIDPAWLGVRYVFDTLLHETIHASVDYRLGGWKGFGDTSHNNDIWVGEVNRIAPLIGIKGVEAGRKIAKRVPTKGKTKTGKRKTEVKKVDLGNVPFQAVATFPQAMRRHFGTAAKYYSGGRMPLPGLATLKRPVNQGSIFDRQP